MKSPIRPRSRKSGLAPGSLVHVGREPSSKATVTLYRCGMNQCEESELSTPDAIKALGTAEEVLWLDVQGTHDAELVQAIGDRFSIHPLVLEDLMNSTKRPKFEDFGDYLFIIAKMIYPESAEGAIHAEQVSLIIGDRWVISCQEHGGDTFNELRNRLRAGKGKVRSCSADFLGYSLLDSIVDGYFGVLERLGDDLERVEQRVLVNPSERSLRDIHRCKRMVMYIRRAIWPLREVMVAFERDDTPLIAPATKLFIRDAYDHTVEVIDIIENFRETSAGLLDVYLSSLSNRLNSTMMVLALVTTIFMPLTFIAGIYGMNFEHMPELKWYYGYPAILAVMGIIAGAMVYLFHRRRWL